ncbi:MAG: protein kinase [Legionellaceae bacterium]|nr:protein kinase [Legionellaceae bacterium]
MPIKSIGPIDIFIPEKLQKARAYSIKFRDALAPDVKYVDDLINTYNQASTNQERMDALGVLEKAIDHMDRKYPDDLKRYFPDYHRKIHKYLFEAIKHERAELGVLPDESNLSFPEYLAIMAPDKVEKMLVILLSPAFTQEKLADNVFNQDEVGYEAFRTMLSRYEISLLGGGNSTNFTVRDTQTLKTSVLKAENRMGMPKDAVQYLRERSMKDMFTQDISEREAICVHPVIDKETGKHKRVTRTLLFTEYHPGGDLKKHAKAQTTPETKIKSAIYVYLQMARALEKMEHDGCCFSDMKNGNWLVDQWGELRIADKKAFLYVHDEEVEVLDPWGDPSTQTIRALDPAYDKNKFYAALRSRQMEPPELASYSKKQAMIDVSKMHAYMLGKNLYQYLTNCSDGAFLTFDKQGEVTGAIHDVNVFDFSGPVFQTPEGILLKRTIQQLIYTDPADAKMVLHDAVTELALIEYPDLFDFSIEHDEWVGLKVDAYLLLKGMARFKVNDDDVVLQDTIDKLTLAIDAANTPDDLLRIQSEIRAMVMMFRENSEQLDAIQEMIQIFKADSSSKAMQKKGAELEAIVLNVPVIERTSIADGKTKHQKTVLETIGREVGLFERLSSTATSMLHIPSDTPSEQMNNLIKFKEKYSNIVRKPDGSDAESDVNIRPQ